MLSEELKKVIKLSGGKIVISQGELSDSYVVMKLNEYLKEIEDRTVLPDKNDNLADLELEDEDLEFKDVEEDQFDDAGDKKDSLTNEELMDRINADIAILKERKSENELEEVFSSEKKSQELDYDYVRG
ncbi:MAG: hypothetical protein U9O20_01090 [Patescibacteria group bacterium]|nr:hypothetical protein [Patescibacteria group bacterium]